jgi:hypothetical protein
MIELGHIQLLHRSAVYDARNKVRSLATALGYDAIESTRLAIAVFFAVAVPAQQAAPPTLPRALPRASMP